MITNTSSVTYPVSTETKPLNQAKNKDDNFETVFQSIIDRKNQSGLSGKDFVETLDNYELSVIQKSKLIADRIRTEKLSAEGAENLFVMQGDDRKYVDLNNDGITEIGEGKMLVFPPPNCSTAVKDAWLATSKDMSFKEKMLIQGRFLAQDLVRRLNGEEKSVYGDSDRDMIDLIDKITEHSKRFANALPVEHRRNNEFVISALERFKAEILLCTREQSSNNFG